MNSDQVQKLLIFHNIYNYNIYQLSNLFNLPIEQIQHIININSSSNIKEYYQKSLVIY